MSDVFGEIESNYDNFPQQYWDWDAYGMEHNWKFENDDITLDKINEETIRERLDNGEELECIASPEEMLAFLQYELKELKGISLYDEENNVFDISDCYEINFAANTFRVSEDRLAEIEEELLAEDC